MHNPALDAALHWWPREYQLDLEHVRAGKPPRPTWQPAYFADLRLIADELARADEDYGDAAERLYDRIICIEAEEDGWDSRSIVIKAIVAALVDAERAGREQMRAERGAKCACQTRQEAPGFQNGGEQVSEGCGHQDSRAEVVA